MKRNMPPINYINIQMNFNLNKNIIHSHSLDHLQLHRTLFPLFPKKFHLLAFWHFARLDCYIYPCFPFKELLL